MKLIRSRKYTGEKQGKVVGSGGMRKIRFSFNSYHLRSRKLEEKLGRGMRQLDGFIPSVAMLLLQVDGARGKRRQFLCQVFIAGDELTAG
jgi:hypothetical protein